MAAQPGAALGLPAPRTRWTRRLQFTPAALGPAKGQGQELLLLGSRPLAFSGPGFSKMCVTRGHHSLLLENVASGLGWAPGAS